MINHEETKKLGEAFASGLSEGAKETNYKLIAKFQKEIGINDIVFPEKITQKEAIEILKANYPDACFGQLRDAVDTAISALEQPEIIRCKDCKYGDAKPIADGRLWCNRHSAYMYYCSDAERREDEDFSK